MRSSALFWLLIPALAACGGKTPKAGSPTSNPSAPYWVARGSRVEKGSIFGVGFTDGVKNTDLARSSAANRGRAEISKILEVYSASLMKDFQESVTAGNFKSSAESQLVSQAIKTFSANLMTGTETKEYWLDGPKGTWYALVELNFDRSKEVAAAKASMPGNTKEWLDQNGGKIFSDMERSHPPSPPARAAENEPPPAPPSEPSAPPPSRPSAPPPPSKPGPTATKGGPPPAWTKGQCDSARYLCGVGNGRDQGQADVGARAELARIFQSNIQSVATSFEGAQRTISSKTGEKWAETQSVTSYSMVSTDKVVTMSEILERWDDGAGRMWALAVIDRAQASTALREQIAEQDATVGSSVDQARGASDKLAKFRALRKAIGALAIREALNSDLRVIEKSGKGVPSPHDVGELISMLDNASEALKIGIGLSGSGSDRVQACLEEGLTNKGLQVQANSSDGDDDDPAVSGDFDVILKGTVKAEGKGQIEGSQVVQINLTLKLINGKTNKVLKTFNASKKASRGDVKSAAATAAYQLCSQKMKDVVDGIDQYFGKH